MDETLLASELKWSRSANTPLTLQLINQFRALILSGRLVTGERLPTTRGLAKSVGLSRNTIAAVYAHLLSEGYVETDGRRGTMVARFDHDGRIDIHGGHGGHGGRSAPAAKTSSSGLSRRGRQITRVQRFDDDTKNLRYPGAFVTGLPDVGAFPHEIWARCVSRRARRARQVQAMPSGYTDICGYRPLRAAIANYVREYRGVRATADNTIIIAGTQAALHLLSQVLLDPKDTAWIEDPGYLGARAALLSADARIVPVPVDSQGLAPRAGLEPPRLIYVTPSHQYPLGVVMSLRRRLDLLERAKNAGAWIIEDDYDSEFRYDGAPIASLHGIDQSEQVIYLGTFSKTCLPQMRLAFMVLPDALIEPIGAALSNSGTNAPVLMQAGMAEFMQDGYYRAHVRRMRKRYGERRDILVDAIRRQADGLARVNVASTGLQCALTLSSDIADLEVSEKALARGIHVSALSRLMLAKSARDPYNGLRLGFAAPDEKTIPRACEALWAVIESCALSC